MYVLRITGGAKIKAGYDPVLARISTVDVETNKKRTATRYLKKRPYS